MRPKLVIRQLGITFNPSVLSSTFNLTNIPPPHRSATTRLHIMHIPTLVQLFPVIVACTTFATASPPILRSLDNAPVLHFTLTRRGGKFAPTEFAKDFVNMTYLGQELEKTEARFNLTQRQVKGNKLVRKAKSEGGGKEEGGLMGSVAEDGIWCVELGRICGFWMTE